MKIARLEKTVSFFCRCPECFCEIKPHFALSEGDLKEGFIYTCEFCSALVKVKLIE